MVAISYFVYCYYSSLLGLGNTVRGRGVVTMGSADHAHSVSRIGYNNIIHNFELRPLEDGLGTDT